MIIERIDAKKCFYSGEVNMALKDTENKLEKLLEQLSYDLVKARKGNKAAMQRVRTGTIQLAKIAKVYRKESVVAGKKGAAKKKTTKKKVVKKKTTATKKAPVKRKVAAKKKAPAKKAAPAKRKTAAKRKAPVKRKAPARRAATRRKTAKKR